MNIAKDKGIVGIAAACGFCGGFFAGMATERLKEDTKRSFRKKSFKKKSFQKQSTGGNKYDWRGYAENGYNRSGTDRAGYGRSYYVESIKLLRRRLDEAYQQLQQGKFRYALYDAYTVMGEVVKLIVQHTNGTDDIGDDVSLNLKICEREGLLGEEVGFMDRLREVFHICRLNRCEFVPQDKRNYGKVHFAVMQMKDLLNLAEKILVRA